VHATLTLSGGTLKRIRPSKGSGKKKGEILAHGRITNNGKALDATTALRTKRGSYGEPRTRTGAAGPHKYKKVKKGTINILGTPLGERR